MNRPLWICHFRGLRVTGRSFGECIRTLQGYGH